MDASVYAILVLLPAFITGAFVAHYWFKPSIGEFLVRLGFLIALVAYDLIFVPIYSDTSYPPAACYLVETCIPLVVLFVRPRVLAAVTAAAFVALTYGNLDLYRNVRGVCLYSEKTYHRREDLNVRYAAILLAGAMESSNKIFAPGYLDEIKDPDVQEILSISETGMHAVVDTRVTPLWHTPLTRLSKFETRPTRIWFSGGTMTYDFSKYHAIGIGSFRTDPNLWRSPMR